jgi:DNA-binding beta-propeller fold protein YncE
MAGAKYLACLLILSGSGLAAATIPARADNARPERPVIEATTTRGTPTAYVANFRRQWVLPITIATRTGRPAIPMPGAGAIAITPDAATAFVGGGQDGVGTITPIALATDKPGPAIPVGAEEIAIAPDGATAYVTGPLGVTPVDVRTHKIGSVIPVKLGAAGIAITPDGTRAFVHPNSDNSNTAGLRPFASPTAPSVLTSWCPRAPRPLRSPRMDAPFT